MSRARYVKGEMHTGRGREVRDIVRRGRKKVGKNGKGSQGRASRSRSFGNIYMSTGGDVHGGLNWPRNRATKKSLKRSRRGEKAASRFETKMGARTRFYTTGTPGQAKGPRRRSLAGRSPSPRTCAVQDEGLALEESDWSGSGVGRTHLHIRTGRTKARGPYRHIVDNRCSVITLVRRVIGLWLPAVSI